MGKPAKRNNSKEAGEPQTTREELGESVFIPHFARFPYDCLINFIKDDVGHSVIKIIRKTVDKILMALKEEESEDSEEVRQGQIGQDERFTLLVNLCKKIVHFGSKISKKEEELNEPKVSGEDTDDSVEKDIDENFNTKESNSKLIKIVLGYITGNKTMRVLVETNHPLERLLKSYCEQIDLKYACAKFKFKYRPIFGKETPHDLGMEQGDRIDVIKGEKHLCKCCYEAFSDKHYGTVLNSIEKEFGKKTSDILNNAFDEIMTVLQQDNDLFDGSTRDKRFSLLVNLSTKILEMGAPVIATKNYEKQNDT